ncbi:RsmE family RNA methyltransferase [Salinispira pacifica]|uniref:16S rRNA (uracil(1498)-N(3))-methyltransferase n=1 Tax=Salinispira pacifica TaxID=1307761 RepID=V5WK86_9SPIO|nr:RsmE family RNA methyltransferase [Salinispira pacifica]AHC16163.1 Putative methyltransferase [Salinispira pacifica]
MNIAVFSSVEWGHSLPVGDYREQHIREQLKLKKGDTLKVGLENQGVGTARLLSSPGPNIELKLEFPRELQPVPIPRFRLIIGHPRPPVFQRLLRDLTSMGVWEIFWVHPRLGEKSYLASKAWNEEALAKQIRLGLEQGGHSRLPGVKKFYSLHACLREIESANQLKIILHPRGDGDSSSGEGGPGESSGMELMNMLCAVSGSEQPGIPTIALGAERGWTEDELQQFSRSGFTRVRLGSSILRTETAALIAAGMLRSALEGPAAHYGASSETTIIEPATDNAVEPATKNITKNTTETAKNTNKENTGEVHG